MLPSLINQWYNAVVRDCGLDPGTFQLVQGEMAVGTNSSFLWNLFDTVPPSSVNHLYDPSQYNVFSANYGAVINNLVPQVQGAATLAQALASAFPGPWYEYLASPVLPFAGLGGLLQEWVSRQPGEGAAASPSAVAEDPVVKAVDLWYRAGGPSAAKAYTGTIDALREALQKAPGATVSMDSSQESADTSRSWAAGRLMLPPQSALTGPAAGDRLEAMVTSEFTVRAVYQHLVVFPALPLTQPNTDPRMSGYRPWFWADALRLAYENDNSRVWKGSAPAWRDIFAPGAGVLQRFCQELVVVDGCRIQVTRRAGGAAGGGVAGGRGAQPVNAMATPALPFEAFLPFMPPSSLVAQPRARLVANAARYGPNTRELTTPVGRPFVLGVNVKPITAAWSADAAGAQG